MLTYKSLYRSDCPWTCRNPPASASQMLRLQMWGITLGLSEIFELKKKQTSNLNYRWLNKSHPTASLSTKKNSSCLALVMPKNQAPLLHLHLFLDSKKHSEPRGTELGSFMRMTVLLLQMSEHIWKGKWFALLVSKNTTKMVLIEIVHYPNISKTYSNMQSI